MIVFFTSNTADSAMIHIPEDNSDWSIYVDVEPLELNFKYDKKKYCIASEQDFNHGGISIPQDEIRDLFNDVLDEAFNILCNNGIGDDTVINFSEILSNIVEEDRFEYWLSKGYIKG